MPSSPKRGAPSAPAREEFIIEVKVDVEVSVKSHFVPIRGCGRLENASRSAAKGRISSTTSMVRWRKDDGHERGMRGADDDSGHETADGPGGNNDQRCEKGEERGSSSYDDDDGGERGLPFESSLPALWTSLPEITTLMWRWKRAGMQHH
jgi:hypothetical protein